MERPSASGASAGAKPRRRDYEKTLTTLEARWKRRASARAKIMQEIVDALWDVFGNRVYSWCGFYAPGRGGQELILGPHRDKPALSPIAVSGIRGKVFLTKEPQIAADVKTLGKDHCIECHPDARSEIVVPVVDFKSRVFAALVIDSKEAGAFGEEDRRWLERILKHLAETPAPDSHA